MSGLVLPFNGIMPKIHPNAFIAESATIIGDVEIGEGSSVWYGCVLRGDVNRIRVGKETNIQDGTVVHCNHDRAGDYRETGGGVATIIGDCVTIGHMALIHACTLEDECFVGMRAVVMDLAVVESRAMVAAGALVSPGKKVGSRELWAGMPAKFRREMTSDDLSEIDYLAKSYRKLAAEYLAGAASPASV
ncbi:MAG: gamma carbonic anhydrase family protein [Kiloniellales bacterium]|nr:gamma carbonic anhydrase family protein [Kiloniellales bacterium]